MKKRGFASRTVGCRTWVMAACLCTVILLFAGSPALAKAYLSVGVLKDPKNFNPFHATDTGTKKVIGLIYQPLYRLDSDKMTLIPWLAEDQPIHDPKRKTITFRLRKMQWDDGTECSAEDVVFTARVFKKFQVPRHYAYWKFIQKIEALDERTVRLTIGKPMPILYTRTLTSWIVQKKKWESLISKADKKLNEILRTEVARGKTRDKAYKAALEGALRVIQTHAVTNPTGLGPFRFKERKRGAHILLLKNDRFFGRGKTIAGRKLGPHIDRVIFKIFATLGTATLALKKGDIDFLWKGVSNGLVKDLLRDPYIRVPMALDSGYRYLAFNLRRAPMSDTSFRRALAYLVDKDFIIERILHRHGERLDTFIPPGNTFFHNSHTPTYGEGMDRRKRIEKAYGILSTSGYRWERPPVDAEGEIQKGRGLIMPNGKAVPLLTILTPSADYDTEMATSGLLIRSWLDKLGVPVQWKPMAFGAVLQKLRNQRDFDMFILGWRSFSGDPDYLRRFFHSSYDRPNKRNYSGYRNSEFDRMADLQAKTMDLKLRQRIVMDLQHQLMKDLPYIPLFVPHRMEGVRTDRFVGWTHWAGGVGNIWSFCLLRPTQWWNRPHPLHK